MYSAEFTYICHVGKNRKIPPKSPTLPQISWSVALGLESGISGRCAEQADEMMSDWNQRACLSPDDSELGILVVQTDTLC